MTVIAMSRTEIDRMHVLREYGKRRQRGLTRRQCSAGEGVSGARAVGAGFDAPRPAEQPPLSGGAPN